MALSWREARECALREGLPQVYHDCDARMYGACREGEKQGSFKEGILFRAPLYLYACTFESRRTRSKRKEISFGKPGLVIPLTIVLFCFPDIFTEPVNDVIYHHTKFSSDFIPGFRISYRVGG